MLFQLWLLVWSGKEVRCSEPAEIVIKRIVRGGCAVKTWSEGYTDFMCRIYTCLKQNEDPWL